MESPSPSRVPPFVTSNKPKMNRFAIGCSLLASMNAIVMGYDIGVMSGASIFIKADLNLTENQSGIVAGILNIYSLVGAAAAGKISDWMGRRYTIVFAATIFFAGSLLMAFANSYEFLMFGRFVSGVAVGYAMMIGPVYTAEIAPASCRGLLTSFTEVFVNIGILLGYISNLALSTLPINLNWRLMLGLGTIPSIILGLGVLAMPESPRWLMMQGCLGKAKRVLWKISESHEEAELRFSEIKGAAGISPDINDEFCEPPERTNPKDVWTQLLVQPTRAVRHMLVVALGIHFFQQASGIDAIVLFGPRIFKKAGMETTRQQLLAQVALGVIKTLFIFVATFFLDGIGRRPLVLSSIGPMALTLFFLAIGLKVVDHNPDHRVIACVALKIFCIFAYVAAFSIGMGPIGYVYCSEVFPMALRAQGCSIGVVLNRVMSGLISMTFLPLSSAVSTGGSFFIYSAIAAIGFVYFYLFLPETKGMTLEEIDQLFGSYIFWRLTLIELRRNDSNETRNQDERRPCDNMASP
ncbi:secondary carrier transporter [Lithospermum erythrorhizon]|uniref:Secondary carrier transporter n=1 Tax=Lithospermum erythrorhizon TaxID=34254 RepID=A0AAV3RDW4_LITER